MNARLGLNQLGAKLFIPAFAALAVLATKSSAANNKMEASGTGFASVGNVKLLKR